MFGGDPFRAMGMMQRQMMDDMDTMMDGMLGSMFGRPNPSQVQAIEQLGSRRSQQQQMNQMQMSPFGMSPFGGLGIFGGAGGIFGAMEQMSQQAMNSPNSVVFSQSTMMTYGPDGRPQVVENTMRKVGDVKETRRHVREGDESRTELGKTIGNRTHVVEKKRDKDGNVRKQQKFINLDEGEVDDFDREFQNRARMNMSGASSRTRPNENQRRITNGEQGGSRHTESSHNAPIVTLPEEDDEEETRRNRSSRSDRRVGGPIIREISDEEAEQSISKKRRGPFDSFKAQ